MISPDLKIAIAESSLILRLGMEAVLHQLTGLRFQVTEVGEGESLAESLHICHPDVLLVNPVMIGGSVGIKQLKNECDALHLKYVALLSVQVPAEMLRLYDEQISIYDTPDAIKQKLDVLCNEMSSEDGADDEQQTLSSREKEIVVCVVKGMTNREIADKLFLSTHTVITHRRNIARKLQIHSASGLTIYAIVNKLVDLSEISVNGEK